MVYYNEFFKQALFITVITALPIQAVGVSSFTALKNTALKNFFSGSILQVIKKHKLAGIGVCAMAAVVLYMIYKKICAGSQEFHHEEYQEDNAAPSVSLEHEKKDNMEKVKIVLKNNVPINKVVNGKTALHIAAQDLRSSLVDSLLKKGADPDIRDNNGKIPLDCAIQATLKQVILNSKSDYELRKAVMSLGRFNGDGKDCDQEMLSRVLLTEKLNTQIYPPLPPFISKEIKIIQKRIPLITTMNKKVNDQQKMSLDVVGSGNLQKPIPNWMQEKIPVWVEECRDHIFSWAIERQEGREIVQFFLDMPGNMLLSNGYLDGMLSFVVGLEDQEMTKLLLQRGASPLGPNKSFQQKTPFHIVTQNGSLSIAKLLVGAVQKNMLHDIFTMEDEEGETPLSLAKKHGHQDIIDLFKDCIADH